MNTPPVVLQGLQNLPTEIYAQIAKELTIRDRWAMAISCKAIRASLLALPELWRHIDIGIFKPAYRREGTSQLLSRAQNSATSISFTNPEMPARGLASGNPALYRYVTHVDCEALAGAMNALPNIDRLCLHGNFVRLYSIPELARVRTLEITGSVEFFNIRALAQASRVQHLTFLNWDKDASVLRSIYSAIFESSLSTLKRISLNFGSNWAARDDLHLSDTIPTSMVQLKSLRGLLAAAPNVEVLDLIGIWSKNTKPGAYGVRNGPLRYMTLLKELTYEVQSDHSIPVPLLPRSLERLCFSLDGPRSPGFVSTIQSVHAADRLIPTTPNLHDLELTFDLVFTFDGESFWAKMLQKSGCRLKTLKLRDGRQKKWINRPWDDYLKLFGGRRQDTWASSLIVELARAGHLRHLRRLEIDVNQGSKVQEPVAEAIASYCPELETLLWYSQCVLGEQSIRRLLKMEKLTRLHLQKTSVPNSSWAGGKS